MKRTTIKSYHELIQLPTFEERFEYLKVNGTVSEETFGGRRYLNQLVYNSSKEWKNIRREVILRDQGFDLAHEDYPVSGYIYVHHINPITVEDVLDGNICIFNLENLISCSFQTHNAIHFGRIELINRAPIVRTKNDTCPWR